ncbi:MAG: hypothetical protein V1867_02005 [Candidatus Falkowbacteria bacterium]
MSNKALSPAELELTQKIQLHFPRNIDNEILGAWNGCSKETLTAKLAEMFKQRPVVLLLDPIGTLIIAPTTKLFVARDHFVENTGSKAKVKIAYLDGGFQNGFIGKTEGPFGGSELRYGKLRRSSIDIPIINELGGEDKAETTLTELWGALLKQPHGEKGSLHTNGYVNIFYIRNKSGVLRAVYTNWRNDGWNLYANSIEDTRVWHAGHLAFFSNSAS